MYPNNTLRQKIQINSRLLWHMVEGKRIALKKKKVKVSLNRTNMRYGLNTARDLQEHENPDNTLSSSIK